MTGCEAVERRLQSSKDLEEPPELDTHNVVVPNVPSQGLSIANVHIGIIAKSHSDAQLGIDDRRASRFLEEALRPFVRQGGLPVQYSPAHQFSDWPYVAIAGIHQIVSQAYAVSQYVAREVCTVNWNPQPPLTFQQPAFVERVVK